MRLDIYLSSNGYYNSREKARIAIKKGIVKVDGNVVSKPSFEVNSFDKIVITKELMEYVSFGGLKLKRAINEFKLDFKDKIILDIGASTGGFTDCALKHGAKLVYAIDVGSNQLDSSLRGNPKVISYENTNILDFKTEVSFDFLVMDVSFVSITKILPDLLAFLNENNSLVCLIKPQFETGHMKIKNGVIKDIKLHKEIINKVITFINSLGLYVNNFTYSTQKGKMGNIEYLALISKNASFCKYNIEDVIRKSHEM